MFIIVFEHISNLFCLSIYGWLMLDLLDWLGWSNWIDSIELGWFDCIDLIELSWFDCMKLFEFIHRCVACTPSPQLPPPFNWIDWIGLIGWIDSDELSNLSNCTIFQIYRSIKFISCHTILHDIISLKLKL